MAGVGVRAGGRRQAASHVEFGRQKRNHMVLLTRPAAHRWLNGVTSQILNVLS